jgi:non-specific serine/threonine protein kinase
MPLAIELAAPLVKVLSLEQILERLEQRFQFLTGGNQTAMPRHRTLRATVDWSYGFLSEPEQVAFQHFSVCAGSFGLEAAQAVLSEPGEAATLELLSRLVDKSMVVPERSAPRAVRYRLLETLREYGKEKLGAAGDLDAVRRRHALHFLNLAETAEPRLTGPEQSAWMVRLDLDYDNFRAALGWSRGVEPETGLRLAAALTRYWYMRGLWSEGRSWLMESLIKPIGDVQLRAKGLLGAGMLAEAHGDYAEAAGHLEQSAAAYRRLGDLSGMARALIQHGRVDYYQGNLDLADSHLEQGLAAGRSSADRWTEALALTELGTVAWRRAAYADARDLTQRGLEMFRELGDRWNVNFAGDYLGHVAHSLKEYSAARRHFEESLALSTELNDLWGIAHSLANLADLSLDERQLGPAEVHLVEAMNRMQELGRPSAIMAVIEGFAVLAAAQAQPLRAITLEGAATRAREEFRFAWRRDLRIRVEAWLPAACSAVGRVAAANAERKGRAMNLDSAVSFALEGVKGRPGHGGVGDHTEAGPALTRREVDIASLVAKGLSNREIAARLFISRRTAETHVDRILTKLDFHSRAQIAVWAAQRGLLSTIESGSGGLHS